MGFWIIRYKKANSQQMGLLYQKIRPIEISWWVKKIGKLNKMPWGWWHV